MKANVGHLLIILIIVLNISNLKANDTVKSVQSGVSFRENKGQLYGTSNLQRPDILYYGGGKGLNYYLGKNGFYCQLFKKETLKLDVASDANEAREGTFCVGFKYKNCNANPILAPSKVIDGVDNYLGVLNADILGVRSYKEVYYSNLYTGIDLNWYGKNDSVEYDYIVKPFADVAKICLVIEGADKISINHKRELEITTPLGKIIQSAPIAYQDGKPVSVKWIVKGNEVSFEIGNYDNSKVLIIDPIIRLWGTYAADAGGVSDLEVDAMGNSYISGSISSASSFIGTSGVFQPTQGGSDGYTVKFNSAGIKQWGTYLAIDNDARGSALDGSSAIYVVGAAGSISSIASIGAHQTAHAGGTNDAYVIKLNANNGTRMWATFYGGTGNDYALTCNVDALGNLIVGGSTSSTAPSTAIATPGAYQNSTTGTCGFIAKFNSSGVRQWGTYYNFGQVASLTSDASQNIYITGHATINGVATSTNVHQSSVAGGWDAYLTKFNPSGVYQWGTYFGGTANDDGQGISTEASGDIYISGITSSSTGISTSGTHQQFMIGTSDAFLARFSNTGNRIWATYFGGSGSEWSNVTCFADGNEVILSGATSSTNNISTPGSYQTSNGGVYDGYFSKFSNLGALLYSTYYGGPTSGVGMSVKTDGVGNYYVAVGAGSTEQSVYVSPGYTAIPSIAGAALAKFRDCPVETVSISSVPSVTTGCSGQSYTLTAITSVTNSPTFQWSNSSTTSSIVITPSGGTNNYYVYLNEASGCRYISTYSMQITATPTITGITSNTSICLGGSVTLNTTVTPTPSSYYWNTGATTASITITPTATAVYSVNAISGSSVCISPTRTVMVTVVPGPSLTTSVVSPTICSGSSNTLIATGATSYSWSTGATTSSIVVTNFSSSPQTFTYSVRGSTSTCASTVVLSYTVIPKPNISIVPSTTASCTGLVTLLASGATSYTWSTGSTSSSIAVSPSVFTNYTLTGMASQCTNSASIVAPPTQTVNVNVSSTSTLLCSLPIQQSATLTGSGAPNYLWMPGSTTSSTLFVNPSTTTTYTLIGSNSGYDCKDTVTITIFASTCTGINAKAEITKEILIYPNPTTGALSLELPEGGLFKITISDVTGRQLNTVNDTKQKTHLDLTGLSNGVYIITVSNGYEKANFRIVKE